MKVRLLSEAERDLRRACAFYESQEVGLGRRLAAEVRSALRRLCLNAGMHSKVHGYYRTKPQRFPFSIFYAIDDTTVTVVAIIDDRSDPDYAAEKLR